MNTIQIPQPFDFHQQISDVVVVGCGVTGSQVARTLCHVVYDLRRRGQHIPSLKFVDPDAIEMKNVGRQMFTEADVGKFKATSLSTRFNMAMGLGIVAYPEPFDAEKHASRYGSLVIGCVDYGGKSRTCLLRTDEAHGVAMLKHHVTQLVNVPVFDAWADYLWDAGALACFVSRPIRAGGIDLWAVELDCDAWTRLICGGLEQRMSSLPARDNPLHPILIQVYNQRIRNKCSKSKYQPLPSCRFAFQDWLDREAFRLPLNRQGEAS